LTGCGLLLLLWLLRVRPQFHQQDLPHQLTLQAVFQVNCCKLIRNKIADKTPETCVCFHWTLAFAKPNADL